MSTRPSSTGRTVVITAGGTTEPIDAVRRITNSGAGTLPAAIANELLGGRDLAAKIDRVIYIHSRDARTPHPDERVELIEADTVAQVEAALEAALADQPHYVVHAMAISDYRPVHVWGHEQLRQVIATNDGEAMDALATGHGAEAAGGDVKLSSGAERLYVALERTPKLIDRIKQLAPHTFLVGFKLLNGVDDATLADVAFKQLRRTRCNLVYANDLARIRQVGHGGLLIYPEKHTDRIEGGTEAVARSLAVSMLARGETRWPRSVQVSADTNASQDVLSQMRAAGQQLAAEGHLPVIDGGTYGNLSVRSGAGFIITGRGIDKGDLTPDRIVHVSDWAEHAPGEDPASYVDIFYHGEPKPSIDAGIHASLYSESDDFDALVHVHTERIYERVPLTRSNYACGTEAERDAVMEARMNDPKVDSDWIGAVIGLYKHGLIVGGDDLDECLSTLATLMGEAMSLGPFEATHAGDAAAVEEWTRHRADVSADEDGLYEWRDLNRVMCLRRGDETVGVVWQRKMGRALQFALYSLEATHGKGLGIGRVALDLIEMIAEREGCTRMHLLTMPKCNVRGYYEAHGFADRSPQPSGVMLMERVLDPEAERAMLDELFPAVWQVKYTRCGDRWLLEVHHPDGRRVERAQVSAGGFRGPRKPVQFPDDTEGMARAMQVAQDENERDRFRQASV